MYSHVLVTSSVASFCRAADPRRSSICVFLQHASLTILAHVPPSVNAPLLYYLHAPSGKFPWTRCCPARIQTIFSQSHLNSQVESPLGGLRSHSDSRQMQHATASTRQTNKPTSPPSYPQATAHKRQIRSRIARILVQLQFLRNEDDSINAEIALYQTALAPRTWLPDVIDSS